MRKHRDFSPGERVRLSVRGLSQLPQVKWRTGTVVAMVQPHARTRGVKPAMVRVQVDADPAIKETRYPMSYWEPLPADQDPAWVASAGSGSINDILDHIDEKLDDTGELTLRRIEDEIDPRRAVMRRARERDPEGFALLSDDDLLDAMGDPGDDHD